MSQPAKADEVQMLPGGDLFWEAYEPAVKCELTSCALQVRPGALILADPIPLAKEAVEELESHGKPVAIVLTSGNHERASQWWAGRYGIPIFAHAAAKGEVEATDWIPEGADALEGLGIVELAGGAPGEIALVRGGSTVVFGDALIHLPSTGLSLLPGKYCSDEKLLRKNLEVALQGALGEVDRAFFAHGSPILSGAAVRLRSVLA